MSELAFGDGKSRCRWCFTIIKSVDTSTPDRYDSEWVHETRPEDSWGPHEVQPYVR